MEPERVGRASDRKTGRGAGRVVELANKLVPHPAEVGRPGCAQGGEDHERRRPWIREDAEPCAANR